MVYCVIILIKYNTIFKCNGNKCSNNFGNSFFGETESYITLYLIVEKMFKLVERKIC